MNDEPFTSIELMSALIIAAVNAIVVSGIALLFAVFWFAT